MFKLIFTILTMTVVPDATPSATSTTNSIDFANSAACQRVLEDFKRRGDHLVDIRGAQVTLHFVGGKCVADGARPANIDPFGLLPR